MDTAIRGSSECLCPDVIYWNIIDDLIFVYIEEYTHNTSVFRLFRNSPPRYDRNRLLYPIYDDKDDYICLYDSLEREPNYRFVKHYDPSPWLDDLLYKMRKLWEDTR